MLRTNLFTLSICLGVFSTGCTNSTKNDTQQASNKMTQVGKGTAKDEQVKNVLFFGTSLTAGYGLDEQQAFPALIQKKIDSLQLPYKVINGGLSGETSAAGKSRIGWQMKQKISIFVLELGANDGLRGIPVKETKANLQSIVDKVKGKYPEAKLVMLGMQMPPSMGQKYTQDFREMFKDVAEVNEMLYVPFLLEGVGGVANLNQADGIHPTAGGQEILAENVWVKLKEIL